MNRITTGPCEECGQHVTKRHRSGRRFLCRECGPKVIAAAANQMAEKKGPAYDSWLAAMAKAVAEG